MEAILPINQLGYPYYLGANKADVVPTRQPSIKPVDMTPTTPKINVGRKPSGVRKQTYYERTGRHRFDVWAENGEKVINFLSQGVGLLQQVGVLKSPETVVYVRDNETGEKRALSDAEKQEYIQNFETGGVSSGNNWMEQYIQFQMLKESQKKDNNLPLFIGLGVGGLLLLTLTIVMINKK